MDWEMRGRNRGQPRGSRDDRTGYTRGEPSRARRDDDAYEDDASGERTRSRASDPHVRGDSGATPRSRRGGPGAFIRPPLALNEGDGSPGREPPEDESAEYESASRTGRRGARGSRRDDRYDDAGPETGYDERPGRRSVASAARDFTRNMSRSLNAVMARTGRVIRDAGRPPERVTPPPHAVAPRASFVPDVYVEAPDEPYRRSRIRLLARKWRLRRIGINPIAFATGVAAVLVFLIVVVFGGGAGALYAVNYYQYHLADIQRLASLKNQANSEIFDRNGKLLYTVRSGDSGFNSYVPLSQISPKLQWATIDIEDHTFYSNVGINFTSTMRAALVDAAHGGAADQGASTITQQLMKNIVLHDTAKAVQRKINEAILSIGVTESGYYTKAQILEWYLNTIPYGDQNMGIEAAARNFFGLQPKTEANGTFITANEQLSWAQAAMLAGLPNAPTMYLPIQYSCDKAPCPQAQWDNPFQGNPADCGSLISSFGPEWYLTHGHEWLDYCRAKLVLDDVRQFGAPSSAGTLTDAEYHTALQQIRDMLVNQQIYHWAGRSNGSAVTALKLAPSFVDYVVDQLATQWGITNLETGGYRIYTTLDYSLNDYIQSRLAYYINHNHKDFWYGGGPPLTQAANAHDGAAIAIDQRNGDILAMVGSVDYNSNNPLVAGKVNITTADRSMGSATKPVVYATAFQMGWTPGTMMQDIPICFPDQLNVNGKPYLDSAAPACKGYYVPHDYDAGNFLGKFPVRQALGNSLNIPATETLSFVGDSPSTADTFLSMAQRLGITTFKKGDMGPTTALGTQVMPLSELTGAYATIANGGRRAPLRAILKIEGPDGSVLYPTPTTPKTPTTYQVLSPQVAYMMTSILTDNTARYADFGTLNPLTWYPDSSSIPIAAKTGTSSGSTGPVDVVTVGYTPFMTLGVWVGNASGAPMGNIIGIAGAGYVFHDALVWAKNHYKWPEGAQFSVPSGMARADFNCDTGLAPYQGQTDMKCPFNPYPTTAQKRNLYDPAGANFNTTTPRVDEDWYIQGQAPLQS